MYLINLCGTKKREMILSFFFQNSLSGCGLFIAACLLAYLHGFLKSFVLTNAEKFVFWFWFSQLTNGVMSCLGRKRRQWGCQPNLHIRVNFTLHAFLFVFLSPFIFSVLTAHVCIYILNKLEAKCLTMLIESVLSSQFFYSLLVYSSNL